MCAHRPVRLDDGTSQTSWRQGEIHAALAVEASVLHIFYLCLASLESYDNVPREHEKVRSEEALSQQGRKHANYQASV